MAELAHLSQGFTAGGNGLKRRRTTRTTEVTIETEEMILLRGITKHRAAPMWCPGCRQHVQMVTPEHASEIAGVTPRTIYRCIEAANVHFVENGSKVLICLPSLTLLAAEQG